MTKIDPKTNLPELPEGQFWRVRYINGMLKADKALTLPNLD